MELPAAENGAIGARRGAAVLALDVDLDVEDHARVVRPNAVHEVAEQRERLVLVGNQRVDLREAAQVDALAQVVHVEQVLAPAFVDDLQQQETLERFHQLLAEGLFARVVALERLLDDAIGQRVAIDRLALEPLAAEIHAGTAGRGR